MEYDSTKYLVLKSYTTKLSLKLWYGSMTNHIPHKIIDVILYPCANSNEIMGLKGVAHVILEYSLVFLANNKVIYNIVLHIFLILHYSVGLHDRVIL